jgi:RNA polymerase sigma-70 factor, ECF subfamily
MSPKSEPARPNLRLVPKEPASRPAVRSPAASPAAPPPALDDSELLAAVRGGDASAATALHDRIRPQIDRTIARLLTPDDIDQDDIAQQAMIELVRTIGHYRGDCALDSWTSTITARVVYKHIRRRRIERRIFGSFDSELVASMRSDSHTGREAMARTVIPRVVAHLCAIDESRAWAFVLHDVCGYDLREIAEITGVTVAAAQTRLVRGRREVHERIAGDPELANLLECMQGES